MGAIPVTRFSRERGRHRRWYACTCVLRHARASVFAYRCDIGHARYSRWNDVYGQLSKVKKKRIKRAIADQIAKSWDFLGIFKSYPDNVPL